MIKVENLTKIYKNHLAVDSISFTINDGEIFGILGPNGAGKTTTLEILETISPKTSGKIEINGFDIDTHPQAIKQIIAVQLQAAGFYPNLNLLEILELFAGLYNKKINPIDYLNKVQLSEKAKSKFKTLSGGQKQRFSIATTLVNDPKIIFLDEPTTGLDPQARRNLWALITDLNKMGKTIVITTHYMDEAEILCDRIAIMNKGKIIAIDAPEKMIDDLIKSGYTKKKIEKAANLEDVFISLTGESIENLN